MCPSCGSLVGVRDEKCYTCGRVNPGLWGYGPILRQLGADLGLVRLVIGASSVLYVLTLLASGTSLLRVTSLFSILSPNGQVLYLFGASGAIPVFVYGRWWTLLSAGWLHGGLLHILFNMMWVRDLGPAAAELFGPARTVIIYTASGVTGFALSSVAGLIPIPLLRGGVFTVGASASIFGLLGALVHYGRSGSSRIKEQALRYAIPLFLFGLIMPGIDNYAHAGGFLGGYATSYLFNPMTRERGDHLIVAVLCLAATLVAVIVSILHGLTIFR